MKKRNWNKYAFELISIFVVVISAFALNNWNDNRKEKNAESKILLEIYNGLEKDLIDVGQNIDGHEQGIKSCVFWRKVLRNETVNLDSVQQHYFILTRDFISIQNTSGYETLKSRGFELVENDILRSKIISIYEFDYQTLRKLEEEYNEVQFHQNYFEKINNVIAPHLSFNQDGDILSMDLPLNISDVEKKVLLSYLWKIQTNRRFVLNTYIDVQDHIKALMADLDHELNK
ncbi:hypothetical protein [Psychroflexus tropicus]|uniref:hypothetical protein n=1 Tax=Psychroflexus tropicus TaxID=197345 RepID=UPI000360ECC6|nr:hypothetical protein [Psychroflexus tropicus]